MQRKIEHAAKGRENQLRIHEGRLLVSGMGTVRQTGSGLAVRGMLRDAGMLYFMKHRSGKCRLDKRGGLYYNKKNFY